MLPYVESATGLSLIMQNDSWEILEGTVIYTVETGGTPPLPKSKEAEFEEEVKGGPPRSSGPLYTYTGSSQETKHLR